MKDAITKKFTFNVPSVFTLDWLFEFHCIFRQVDTRLVVVDINEPTIGSVQVRVQARRIDWNTRLWVWEQCRKLALNYAINQNNRDSRVVLKNPHTSVRTEG